MKQANHLFMAFLLIAALGLASCSGKFDEHPEEIGYTPETTSLIQTLDSINNSLDPTSTTGEGTMGGDLSAQIERRFGDICER